MQVKNKVGFSTMIELPPDKDRKTESSQSIFNTVRPWKISNTLRVNVVQIDSLVSVILLDFCWK